MGSARGSIAAYRCVQQVFSLQFWNLLSDRPCLRFLPLDGGYPQARGFARQPALGHEAYNVL